VAIRERNEVGRAEVVLLPTDAVYHYSEMWNLDAGEFKYVRDVRGVRTTC
jgi:hypothetical protein